MVSQTALRIGILGFEGANALDIVGPAEAFDSARIVRGDGPREPCYEVILIGLTRRSFTTEAGLVFHPKAAISDKPALDTLIIPGGACLRTSKMSVPVAAWLSRQAAQTRRVASVCTGAFGLAAAGLLEGRKVTTHWRFSQDLATRYPGLKVDSNPLFLRDGKYYTSAGVTAGIDLALALIEEDFGRKIALAVAREMVVYLKRPGGQEQFSEPLKFQIEATDRFNDIASYISANLHRDLSVDALSKRAAVCERHFRRLFRNTFGDNPASYIETLRLTEARQRLSTSRHSVEAIAASVGFATGDSFRRVFRKRFGIAPGEYRGRFNTTRRSLVEHPSTPSS